MCTQSRNQYWVAHHTLHEGKEPEVEVGRGTTKLDLVAKIRVLEWWTGS